MREQVYDRTPLKGVTVSTGYSTKQGTGAEAPGPGDKKFSQSSVSGSQPLALGPAMAQGSAMAQTSASLKAPKIRQR